MVERAGLHFGGSATSGGRPRPLRICPRRPRRFASVDDASAGRRQVSFKSMRSPICGVEPPSVAPAFVTPASEVGIPGHRAIHRDGPVRAGRRPDRGVRNQFRVNCVVATRSEFETGGIRCESVCSERPGVLLTGTRGRMRNTSIPGSGNSRRADRGDGADTSAESGRWPWSRIPRPGSLNWGSDEGTRRRNCSRHIHGFASAASTSPNRCSSAPGRDSPHGRIESNCIVAISRAPTPCSDWDRSTSRSRA